MSPSLEKRANIIQRCERMVQLLTRQIRFKWIVPNCNCKRWSRYCKPGKKIYDILLDKVQSPLSRCAFVNNSSKTSILHLKW